MAGAVSFVRLRTSAGESTNQQGSRRTFSKHSQLLRACLRCVSSRLVCVYVRETWAFPAGAKSIYLAGGSIKLRMDVSLAAKEEVDEYEGEATVAGGSGADVR